MQIFWNNVTKYFLTLLTNHLCGVTVAGFIEAGFTDSNQVKCLILLWPTDTWGKVSYCTLYDGCHLTSVHNIQHFKKFCWMHHLKSCLSCASTVICLQCFDTVGWAEEHPVCKKWVMRCHCIPKPYHLLVHLNSDWFSISGAVLPRLSW